MRCDLHVESALQKCRTRLLKYKEKNRTSLMDLAERGLMVEKKKTDVHDPSRR